MYRAALGVSRERYESLREHLSERRFRGRTYRHLPDYSSGFDRGLVLVDGEVVPGYPKIPRTLVLRTGVPEHFEGTDEIVVEEKLNGYNARVATVGGDVLAFTRSGIVCPFTTETLRGLLPAGLFADHPHLVLCGEVIGPENPYIAHDYPGVDSVGFRAFDLRRRPRGEPLSVADRRDLCARYGVPQVPFLGRLSISEAVDVLPEVVRELDADDREGVVMKSPDSRTLLKYTTGYANRDDLRYAFSLPFDRGQSFMFRRLVREAFQSVEWGEDEAAAAERARKIGESILLPTRETVRSVEAGDVAGETFTVRAAPAVVDELRTHLASLGLSLDVLADRTDGDERVFTFRKVARPTTDKTRSYLSGHVVRE